jgi:transposase
MPTRKPYPSDVSDEEWAFVAPYLALVREDAPQRTHDLREVFNGLRWVVRTGSPWRYMPHDLPPWEAVYQQTQRWIAAGCFKQMVHDLRALLRLSETRASEPTAAIIDSRTLRSSPESGHRSGYDGAKRKKGSKVHAAVDTLGHLLALLVTPANEQDREHVEVLASEIQGATGESVELAGALRVGAPQISSSALSKWLSVGASGSKAYGSMREEPQFGHCNSSSSGSTAFSRTWCSENTPSHTRHTSRVSLMRRSFLSRWPRKIYPARPRSNGGGSVPHASLDLSNFLTHS